MSITSFSERTRERLPGYMGLAYSLVANYRGSILPSDELLQVALIGIARGLETFREGGASELSWLHLKGKNAIKDALRAESRKRANVVNLKWQETFDVEQDFFYPGGSVKEELSDEEELKIKIMKKAMSKLDTRTRTIVRRIAEKGERQIKVAKSLGISQGWCSRLYNRGLRQLREYIETEYKLLATSNDD